MIQKLECNVLGEDLELPTSRLIMLVQLDPQVGSPICLPWKHERLHCGGRMDHPPLL